MGVDIGNLEAYLDLLESADETINRENARLLKTAADDLTEYAQSIEFRQSGNMADSTHPLGPFASGGGILTSTIQSAASYADMVAQFDEAHDWPARTVADQQARLDQLQNDAADVVVRAVSGS